MAITVENRRLHSEPGLLVKSRFFNSDPGFQRRVMRLPGCVQALGNNLPATVEGETSRVEQVSGKSALFA